MPGERMELCSTRTISCRMPGLVPLLELAEQAGLSQLLDEPVRFTSERVKSGAANPTPKLTSIIAGMAAGADSIDDLDVVRAGGMKQLFGGVYACATLGISCGVHPWPHPATVGGAAPASGGAGRADPGAGRHPGRCLHRHRFAAAPGVRHAKQGASFGHAKIAGKTILRRGLSPRAVTISARLRRRWWPGRGCGPGGPVRPKARRV
jgi:hypothetical protein